MKMITRKIQSNVREKGSEIQKNYCKQNKKKKKRKK